MARFVHDGDSVALEGFTHLIPFAAAHEILRQGRKDLTLIRMTPDLIYDQMIGMGAARRLIFSWGGNPGVGSLHRLRDAVEKDWPQPLEIVEHSHAAMANAYEAGAAGLPCAIFRGYRGSDLPCVNPQIKFITCPFTGEELACIPALRPDVTIIHAQKADREGNVLIEGIVGVQKEAALAARRAVVTVEEIVDDFGPRSANAVILPSWSIRRGGAGARRGAALLRPRLLRARQCVLHRLGRNCARTRDASGPGWRRMYCASRCGDELQLSGDDDGRRGPRAVERATSASWASACLPPPATWRA